jgi:hypothetical protein
MFAFGTNLPKSEKKKRCLSQSVLCVVCCVGRDLLVEVSILLHSFGICLRE